MRAWPWSHYPLERNTVPNVPEAAWAPGTVLTCAENLVPTLGFNPQPVQTVASHYTHLMKAYRRKVVQLTSNFSTRCL